ncbi:hypothetical protein SEVIR_2G399700v4 [Setaria viridis]
MAAVTGPLCTWLVAACLSAACDADEHKQKHCCPGGSSAGAGVMFGQGRERRRLGAWRRGAARSGMAMSVALQAERNVIEKKKPDIKQRRVVVTGMGVVTPLGHDPDVFYNNLLDGVSGISEIERFDCSNFPTRIAGEIKSFSTDGWVAPKLAKRMDKFMLYLITAGKKALENGGLTEELRNELDKTRCGVLIGSAMGGMKVFNDAIEALRVSYKKMNPFCVPFATTNMGSAILAMDLVQHDLSFHSFV